MSQYTEKRRISRTFGALANLMNIRAVCFSKFLSVLFACVFSMFFTISDAAATFTVTTTSVDAGGTFTFTICAKGTFTVDCGEGGTLSGASVSGSTISRPNNVTHVTYTCTYETAGVKTLTFGGTATGYDSNNSFYGSTIDFKNNTLVASVSGDFSTVFPQLGTANNQIPHFASVFSGCTSLTSISDDLFSGYTFFRNYMFYQTFYGCTGLTSIPAGLFSTITTGKNYMFSNTFLGCTGLTSIPDGLFSNITTSADHMFYQTFGGCTALTGYVPPTLFAGLVANGSPKSQYGMLYVFNSTNLATSCPTGTTKYTTGYESDWSSKVSCVSTSPFTVTYDCGDGTGTAPSNGSATYNSSFTPATSTCTPPSGYMFVGWSISPDHNVYTRVPAGQAFTWNYAENKTFTAEYKQKFSVTYNCGDGGGTPPATNNSVPYGETFTPPANTCNLPSGKVFSGWLISGTNTKVQSGEEFTWEYTEDKTFTAQFAPKYTVTYNCGSGGGTAPATNNMVIYSNPFTPDVGCTTPEGYLFTGWLVSGTSTVVASTFIWEYTENKTLTAQYENPAGFGFNTVYMEAGGTFSFKISAKGTFTVDCGDGGTLTGPGVSGNTITRTTASATPSQITYTCSYSTPGIKAVRIGGTATEYYTGNVYTPPIDLSSNTLLTSIAGDFSTVFPQLGSTDTTIPTFFGAFQGCTNLTQISGDLFSGYTFSRPNMFEYVFRNCTRLTSIPAGLFSSFTTGATGMFYAAFQSSGLTSIPDGLFASFTTGAYGMFRETFEYCTGLTVLPESLFAGITNAEQALFQYTFNGCSNLAGYVPYSMFTGLINNGSPTANAIMAGIFDGTKVLANYNCPNGTVRLITGYETCCMKRTSCGPGSNITYACGTGASGTAPGSTSVAQNAAFTPAANTCTKTGNTFNGWLISGTSEIKPAGTEFTWTYTGDKTLTAQWTPVNYTVSFAKGSGSGTMSSQTNKHYQDTITLPANGFTAPSGYFFRGWNCNNSIGDKLAGATFSMPAANVTCTAQYAQDNFSVTTISTNSFKFSISAKGTFYVDCGSGGTLSGTGVSANVVISRTSDTTEAIYTCSYSSASAKTIRFSGAATGYNTSTNPHYASISFYAGADDTEKAANAEKVASISGNLSTVFPRLGTSTSQNPKFYQTFQGCTGLTSVPATLFSGITAGANYMFYNTFYGCTGLTGTNAIPAGLFSGITTSAAYMFYQTFQGCTGLTSIPSGLFAGITAGQSNMFRSTFQGCTGITAIPSGLFSNITTGATRLFQATFYGCTGLTGANAIPSGLFSGLTSTSGATYMFNSTFYGCSGITAIPTGLFSKITTGEAYMFYCTFQSCTGLTSIPDGLFSNITTSANYMFYATFYGCNKLTALPENLFSGVTTEAVRMFFRTFRGCSKLTGYIPKSMFTGLVANGHPYDETDSGMMYQMFYSTGSLATSCPNGTIQYITGYEDYWNSHVSCEPGSNITYDCGTGDGGSAPSGIAVAQNASFTPAANTCTKTGYTFSGWLISGTSVTKPAGTAFTWTYTGDKTLTAQWTGNAISTTWNTGTGTTTSGSCDYGGIMNLPTAPTRTGYNFDGWTITQ